MKLRATTATPMLAWLDLTIKARKQKPAPASTVPMLTWSDEPQAPPRCRRLCDSDNPPMGDHLKRDWAWRPSAFLVWTDARAWLVVTPPCRYARLASAMFSASRVPIASCSCPVSTYCWKLVTLSLLSFQTWQTWASMLLPVAL